jgi:hypothetical protein
MARGWESKSVEAQIDEAAHHRKAFQAKPVNRQEADRVRKRESLLLSRRRVLHEIAIASNPRYKQLMQKTLEELDSQLAALPG